MRCPHGDDMVFVHCDWLTHRPAPCCRSSVTKKLEAQCRKHMMASGELVNGRGPDRRERHAARRRLPGSGARSSPTAWITALCRLDAYLGVAPTRRPLNSKLGVRRPGGYWARALSNLAGSESGNSRPTAATPTPAILRGGHHVVQDRHPTGASRIGAMHRAGAASKNDLGRGRNQLAGRNPDNRSVI
jgi:hypothetical protein